MNKKGMTTVFICIIAGSIVSMIILFITAANREAAAGYTAAVFNLAGRSVLSEYDRELYERYGLMAFYGNMTEIKQKIEGYADYSFKDNSYVKYDDVDVSLLESCLLDRKVFENEVNECTEANTGFPETSKKKKSVVTSGDRTLRNSEIIDSLPSAAVSDKGFDLSYIKSSIKGLSSPDAWIKSSGSEFLCSQYIFNYFTSGMDNIHEKKDTERFFHNEVEYIVFGEKSDRENLDKMKKSFTGIRFAMNLVFLETSEEKRRAVKTFVTALNAATAGTTAAAEPAEEAAIRLAWAYIESSNDWNRLKKGYKVALFKDDKTWATDIDSAGDTVKSLLRKGNDTENPDENIDISDPEDNKGFDYDGYLRLFLHFTEDDVKYARMQDLIQINLKGTYWGNLTIKNFYTGFSFSVKVNGKEYEYAENY